ncbi:MAG: alpha/beta hydrolase [Micrococcales bacterium]|nr:alpha/beta hydrolase [Micrococcales bacterium]
MSPLGTARLASSAKLALAATLALLLTGTLAAASPVTVRTMTDLATSDPVAAAPRTVRTMTDLTPGASVAAAPVTARMTTDLPIGEENPAYRDFYSQVVEWGECSWPGPHCATLEMPMDWNRPEGLRITIALSMLPAKDQGKRIGSLLFNPGGPGASAIDSLDDTASGMPENVRERYDIVAFDPRGVGHSSAVACLDDEALGEYLEASSEASGGEAIIEYHKAERDFAKACMENTGALLGYVDSLSAARDMDVIRAALSEETLTYIGWSYGTFLGALYAQEYGKRAGRLVLDGAVDPTLSAEKASALQMESFDRALRAYIQDCVEHLDCPLSSTTAKGPMAQITDLLDTLASEPLPTGFGDRKLTEDQAVLGILEALYSEDWWTNLSVALDSAMNSKDGTTLLFLADYYHERDSETGAFRSNMIVANTAINCLDHPVDARRTALDAAAKELTELSPFFGEYFQYGSIGCAVWPYPARLTPGPITAPDAPPIVVVGTTGDPATPYEDAVNLARSLTQGVLVTYEGEGHTAFGGGVKCIDTAIEAFLVDGTVPQNGLTCK